MQWRAWFWANKLLQDHARRLLPPGGGGCGACWIPAEPRAAGRGGAAALCAGTLTSPQRPRLRGQRGQRLRSGWTRCALCLLKEGGTGPGTPGPDPDPPPRQPKPDLGTPARVEVGNSTGYTSVRACASWLSPLRVTASNPRDRSPTAFVACSVHLPRSSRPFHPHQHRTHFCFSNPTRKSTEN